MTLMKCPVCEREIERQVTTCPHCDYGFTSPLLPRPPIVNLFTPLPRPFDLSPAWNGLKRSADILIVLGALLYFYHAEFGSALLITGLLLWLGIGFRIRWISRSRSLTKERNPTELVV